MSRHAAARVSASLLAIGAVIAVAGCTSDATGHSATGHSATGKGATGEGATGEGATVTAPPRSTTHSVTRPSPSPSTTDAATEARAQLASAVQVDADDFDTGSYDPSVPAAHLPYSTQFTTPSGNIRCTIREMSPDPASLICAYTTVDFATPPKPADCNHDWAGATFSLDQTGVRLGLCLGDEEVTYSSRTLDYGDAIQTSGIGCYSSSAALTCLDTATGHGFTANRSRFTQF